MIEVIEHLKDDAFAELLEDVRRLLAPDGIIIFTTPRDEDLAAATVYCPNCETMFHRWQHVRSWTPTSLRATMDDHQYTVCRCFGRIFRFRGD